MNKIILTKDRVVVNRDGETTILPGQSKYTAEEVEQLLSEHGVEDEQAGSEQG